MSKLFNEVLFDNEYELRTQRYEAMVTYDLPTAKDMARWQAEQCEAYIAELESIVNEQRRLMERLMARKGSSNE